jgi:hypothetical protein
MKTITILLSATIGMSTDNYLVMAGAITIVGILTLKSIKK